MKKNFGLLITALLLLAVFLFLLILIQGREEKLALSAAASGEGAPTAVAVGDIVFEKEEVYAPSFPVFLEYTQHQIGYSYIWAENGSVSIYGEPSATSAAIRTMAQNDKLDYMKTVSVKTGEKSAEDWYLVKWQENGTEARGYVETAAVIKRDFRFDRMEEAVTAAQLFSENGPLTYIDNCKNRKGEAPLYKGGTVDAEGNNRSQSAPAYPQLSDPNEFVYVTDGTLVRYLSADGDYVHVKVLKTGKSYYIHKRYIPRPQALTSLSQIIVIDRNNQNEAVYEKINNAWTMISYTLATTGKIGTYSKPTPTGYYFAIEKRSQFFYYKDGTKIFQGYAPYAIRFTDGAYIHGVPVNYKYSSTGAKIIPAKIEFTATMGTIPLSHKCVRNYTSHAKFLYDRVILGEAIVIVI